MTFGQTLKSKRLEKGLTQEQVAEQLATHKQIVSHWERDKNHPQMIMLISLADLLDCSIDELVGRA